MTARPLSYRQAPLPPDAVKLRRRKRYALHAEAARLVGGRVGSCGQRTIAGPAYIVKAEGRPAHIAGVETCSSIWACPKCAPKIAETRRAEVASAVDLWQRAGGSVYMLALTVRHNAGQRCKPLKQAVAECWRKVCSGAPWERIKGRGGCNHMIRAMEVTHGKNGWHPHIHVLVFLDHRDDERAQVFGWKVFERWARFVDKAGFGPCNPSIFSFEPARDVQAAGDYVAKWGSDREICFGHLKQGKQGGRSPWQLLADSAAGDKRAGTLFREYHQAFFRARHLTWTRGTKDFFGLRERDDEEIAAAKDERAETVATISAEDYRALAWEGQLPAVLEAAERGGKSGVSDFIRRWRRRRERRPNANRRRSDPGGPRESRVDRFGPGNACRDRDRIPVQH